MTKKELDDFALNFATLINIANEAESPEDISNSAIDMVKDILNRYPKLRFRLYEMGESEMMDKLGCEDYGSPW